MKKILKKLSLFRDINLALFESKWRKNNKHNFTIPKNKFPINKVSVGNNTYGGLNIYSFGNNDEQLVIGAFCSIAPNVSFLLSGEHDYRSFSTYPFIEKKYNRSESISKGPIIIDDDVWIGFGSIILSGVHIGQGAVIGAGSVVSKDIPPYAIYVGNRVIKYRFDDTIVKKLLSIDLKKIDLNSIDEGDLFNINEENVDMLIDRIEGKNES